MISRQRALTLIELIIAMSIMSVVTIGSYAMFELVQKAQQSIDRHSSALTDLQRGLRWLSVDIATAVSRPIRDEFGGFANAIDGSVDSIELTRNSIIKLDLSSFGESDAGEQLDSEGQQQQSELLRVRYQVEEDSLVRIHWPSLDRSESAEAESSVVMKSLEGLQFRYYYKPNEGAGKWYSSWPPESLTSLNASSIFNEEDDPDGMSEEERVRRLLPQVIEVNIETEQYGKLTKLTELASYWPENDQVDTGQAPGDNEDDEDAGDDEAGDFDDEDFNDEDFNDEDFNDEDEDEDEDEDDF